MHFIRLLNPKERWSACAHRTLVWDFHSAGWGWRGGATPPIFRRALARLAVGAVFVAREVVVVRERVEHGPRALAFEGERSEGDADVALRGAWCVVRVARGERQAVSENVAHAGNAPQHHGSD